MLPHDDRDDEDVLQRWLAGRPEWPLDPPGEAATLDVRLVGDDCHLYDAAQARAVQLAVGACGRDGASAERVRQLLDAVIGELTA